MDKWIESKNQIAKNFYNAAPNCDPKNITFYCKLVSFNWLSHDLSHKVTAKNKSGNQVWAIDLSIFFSSVWGIAQKQIHSVIYWKLKILYFEWKTVLTVQSMQFQKRNSMSYVDDNK